MKRVKIFNLQAFGRCEHQTRSRVRRARTILPLVLMLLIGEVAGQEWEDYYSIESIDPPEGVVAEVGGIDVLDDGRLVVAFERGEIYFYDPDEATWQKFADGLHHPLGILAKGDDEVLVTQRPEVTRLRDTTGDGVADHYETMTDDFGMAGNHSEFNFGLVEDDEGNLFFSLGTLSVGIGPRFETRGEVNPDGLHGRMYSAVPYRGWIMKLTPDGELIPYASGLRNANGLGLDDQGRLFVADNQGDWVGTSPLYLIEEGGFYGHAPSLVWEEGWNKGIPAALGVEYLEERRVPPVAKFPHGVLSNSPTQPLQDNTGGAFGPFEGQFFIGEMNHPHLIRFMPDEVGGVLQGAAARFHAGHGLRRGNNRLAFAPDGSLWTGQTERERAWAGDTGIHRITWTGKTPLEVQHVALLENGFRVTLTKPIDPGSAVDPEAFPVERFRYHYHEPYGSPQVGNAKVKVSEVQVAPDGGSIDLLLEQMVPDFIYAFDFSALQSEEGESIMHPEVWYTLRQLKNADDDLVSFRLDEVEGELTVTVEGHDALTYRFGANEPLQYYYPVLSPSGKELTVREAEPWTHHRSLWIADEVGFVGEPAIDFYHGPREYDMDDGYKHYTEHQRFTRALANDSVANFGAEIQWLIDGERPVIDEERSWTVTALGDGEYLVDLEWELTAAHGNVAFPGGWTHYGWPYVRMHPQFSGDNGGTITNDRGGEGQEETNDRQARWVDYSNTVNGRTEGLAIFAPHGEERRWLTREYGTFGPRRPPSLDGTGFTLERGESLAGRAGILIHNGDVADGRVAERYEMYLSSGSMQEMPVSVNRPGAVAHPSKVKIPLPEHQGGEGELLELSAEARYRPEEGEVIWRGPLDGRTVTIDRFDGERDRMYSAFLVVGDDGTAIGAPVWATRFDLPERRERPFLKPETKKGLNCLVMVDDAVELGVGHAVENIAIGRIVDLENPDPELYQVVDGHKVGFDREAVERMDKRVREMTEAGIDVTGILLNPKPDSSHYAEGERHSAHSALFPSRAALDGENVNIVAFNLETPEGIGVYRAVIEFLAERYTRPDRRHGWMSGLIIGNEIQAHWVWHNLGRAEAETVLRDYLMAMRLADIAGRSRHRDFRVVASMTHHWMERGVGDPQLGLRGAEMLEFLNTRGKSGGDFPWGVAFHPYPENLFRPDFWNDRSAWLAMDSPKVTMKNIEVLDAFMARPEMGYAGKVREIILSEQGFHGPPGDAGERLQAAALAYAFEKVERMPAIKAFHLHRHVDHPHEGGLLLGLWTHAGKPEAPECRKMSWEVFRAFGGEEWAEVSAPLLVVAGLTNWEDAAPVPREEIPSERQVEVADGVVADLFQRAEEVDVQQAADFRRDGFLKSAGWLADSLFHHPPNNGSSQARFTLEVPDGRDGRKPVFTFGTGLSASAETGVIFRVCVNGLPQFEHHHTEQVYTPHELELEEWAGEEIVLTLEVDANGSSAHDWAHWIEPQVRVSSR